MKEHIEALEECLREVEDFEGRHGSALRFAIEFLRTLPIPLDGKEERAYCEELASHANCGCCVSLADTANIIREARIQARGQLCKLQEPN